jgi:hypothetical protein
MAEKNKNNPYIKVKSIEVSAETVADKVKFAEGVERQKTDGWELVQKRKVRNEPKYILTFEYHLNEEEIKALKRKAPNKLVRFGCLSFLGICGFLFFLASISPEQNQSNARTTREEPTQLAQTTPSNNPTESLAAATAKMATNTAVPIATELPPNNVVVNEPSATSFIPMTLTSQVLTATALFFPSRTPEPTNVPRPTEPETNTYYVIGSTANVRSCADTTCDRVIVLDYGKDIEVIGTLEGTSVAGSVSWYKVLLADGREGFIHSSLVSRNRPIAGTSNGSSGSSSTTSNSSSNIQPTAIPQAQAPQAPVVQPTQPPPPPAPSGYTCDCNKTCSSMTCQEAYYQLNTCGCQARDNDNDGVPCESVCPGG